MELRWIGGPMLIINTTAYGLWFNWDMTPWRDKADERGMWFGRRQYTESKEDGDTFERTIIAIGVIALVRNRLLTVPAA